MRNVLKIYLYSIRQLPSLYRIHRIQSFAGEQKYLKTSIHIKMLQQFFSVCLLVFGCLNCRNQSRGNLLIGMILQKHMNTEIFYHIWQMYFPWLSQKRKIIFVTVCLQFFWYLINILSHINDQSGGMIFIQQSCKIHPVFFLWKAKPCCHCEFLSPKVLYDRGIFQKMHPADWICPAIFSCKKLHFISLFCRQYHIFYCKTHIPSPLSSIWFTFLSLLLLLYHLIVLIAHI